MIFPSIVTIREGVAPIDPPTFDGDYVVETGGTVFFPADTDGYKIPDYSYVGYNYQGEGDLPTYGVEYEYQSVGDLTGDLDSGTSEAVAEANQALIQAAIDAVEALTPNGFGYRGTVNIPAGTWYVRDEVNVLKIEASGVVIRGAGMGTTILQEYYNGAGPEAKIQLGPTGSMSTGTVENYFNAGQSGTNWNITTDVVNVGDLSFDIASGHSVIVGDEIIIYHPCSTGWLTALGNPPPEDPWEADQVPIRYWRTVTAVDGTNITVDSPVYYSLVKANAQCTVYKYTETFIEKVGIENITIDCDRFFGDEATDDNGSIATAVQFRNVKHGFCRNVDTLNFRNTGFHTRFSSQITFADCIARDNHAPIAATFRYNYNAHGGQNCLYVDCSSADARHSFTTNGWAADSGHVLLRFASDRSYAQAIESGHQRWSSGFLFDQVTTLLTGSPEATYSFSNQVGHIGNHGNNGNVPLTGNAHGWTGATTVVWRCAWIDSPALIWIQVPPTALVLEYLSTGNMTPTNGWGTFPGNGEQGMDATTSGTMPTSLYETQLAQRLS